MNRDGLRQEVTEVLRGHVSHRDLRDLVALIMLAVERASQTEETQR